MPRFLHTSIFVNDMDESIAFYTEKLGLELLDGPYHYPGNADMAFVGSDWNSYVELVYDLEAHPPYELGKPLRAPRARSGRRLTQYVAVCGRRA